MEALDMNMILSTLKGKDNNGLLHVSLVPPKEGKRKPAVVICMLDVSGSMDSAGSIEQSESGGFSILDLVKHAVKTIANILSPEDYLCLIEFESNASTIFNLQQLTPAAKTNAEAAIEAMRTKGGTNIWSALKLAMQTVQANPICQKLNTSLWLFTDGESEQPPGGIVQAMKDTLIGERVPYTINTFGFGYNMDSKLLKDLTLIGSGIFCYVPDCNIIGTTFINCLANVLSAVVNQSWLEIKATGLPLVKQALVEYKEILPGTSKSAKKRRKKKAQQAAPPETSKEVKKTMGASEVFLPAIKAIGYEMIGNSINIGTIQYGQTRDFIFEFPTVADAAFKIELTLHYEGKALTRTIEGFNAPDPLVVFRTLSRARYCDILDAILTTLPTQPTNMSFLTKIQEELSSYPCKDEVEMKALMRDIVSADEMEGRVTKAFSMPERIQRWGQHYVRSIVRAHQIQQCHNFKDPGVQVYGGNLFKEIQKKADMTFCSLPPPKQSRPQDLQPKGSASAPAQAPAAAVNMQSYMECGGGGGGCFDGEGEVKLVDGTVKKVKELKKDDQVLDSTGQPTRVVCLVAFRINRTIPVVKYHGLLISPKHPLRSFGQWHHANDLAPVEHVYCESIYNLVLEKNHVVSINNIDLITLGHGMSGPVVEHPYYGSQLVINDLKRAPGWAQGAVIMTHCHKSKDPTTGLVIGLTTVAA